MNFSREEEDSIELDELEKLILNGQQDFEDEDLLEAHKIQNLLETQNAFDNNLLKSKKNENSEKDFLKNTFDQEEHSKNETNKDAFNKVANEVFGNTDDLNFSNEEIKCFLNQKYNEYGEDINEKLKEEQKEIKEKNIAIEINKSLSNELYLNISNNENYNSGKNLLSKANETRKAIVTNDSLISTKNKLNSNIYVDPIFGIRIVNPLVSSSFLKDRMEGKKAVGMNSVNFHIQKGNLKEDWVIAGAIVSKSPVKTAKNGSSFSVWRISDLKGEIKMLSLFLFKNAHKELWKTVVGMVIAILNPRALDNKQKNDVACLSIDNAQSVMVLGQSKDLGWCKGKKKNGDDCKAVINLGECEFCLYHIQQEFGRMSRRSELQSATSGRGLEFLRNKVLGKSEVFYGGQSYMATPARKSIKQEAKDQKRLTSLTEYFNKSNSSNSSSNYFVKKDVSYETRGAAQGKLASSVEVNIKQRVKDLERLKILKCDEDDNEIPKTNVLELSSEKQKPNLVPEKFRNKDFSFSLKTPTLSKESFSVEINLSRKKAEFAKSKALEIIKKKPIVKEDPNFVKYRGTPEGRKRLIDEINKNKNEAKKRKLEEEENSRKSRIQRIMEATSIHVELLKSRENEEQEKYFKKMEKKELLEEKMLKTYKVPCKAVICLKCKYTAFSASDHCKEEKHPFKVIDTEKRFFQCKDCGNRTVSVYKIPKLSCKNCNSSKWQRAPMIREKKVDTSEKLSIRGDEEKFFGTLNSSVSLNLLVSE